MKNKIDGDIVDNELAAIRELIGNMESDDKSKLASIQSQVKPA